MEERRIRIGSLRAGDTIINRPYIGMSYVTNAIRFITVLEIHDDAVFCSELLVEGSCSIRTRLWFSNCYELRYEELVKASDECDR